MRSFAIAIVAAVASAQMEMNDYYEQMHHTAPHMTSEYTAQAEQAKAFNKKIHGYYQGHPLRHHQDHQPVEHRTYSEHHYAPYYYGNVHHLGPHDPLGAFAVHSGAPYTQTTVISAPAGSYAAHTLGHRDYGYAHGLGYTHGFGGYAPYAYGTHGAYGGHAFAYPHGGYYGGIGHAMPAYYGGHYGAGYFDHLGAHHASYGHDLDWGHFEPSYAHTAVHFDKLHSAEIAPVHTEPVREHVYHDAHYKEPHMEQEHRDFEAEYHHYEPTHETEHYEYSQDHRSPRHYDPEDPAVLGPHFGGYYGGFYGQVGHPYYGLHHYAYDHELPPWQAAHEPTKVTTVEQHHERPLIHEDARPHVEVHDVHESVVHHVVPVAHHETLVHHEPLMHHETLVHHEPLIHHEAVVPVHHTAMIVHDTHGIEHHQDPVAFQTALTHEPVGHETTHKELSHVQERESTPVHARRNEANEYYRYGDVSQGERILHKADDSHFRAAAYAKNLSSGSFGFLQ